MLDGCMLSHDLLPEMARIPVGGFLMGAGEGSEDERPVHRVALDEFHISVREVTNEDYAGCLVRFANGSVGSFEVSRSIVGPQSQMAFEIYGTKGSVMWNLETMNEMQVFLTDGSSHLHDGYTTVYAGDRYPFHGAFVPGDANAIGFEDLKVIEDLQFLAAVVAGEQHEPGFSQAVDYVSVQAAMIRSWEGGSWEPVISIRID